MTIFPSFPPKDPDAKLDYVFDWAPLKNNRGLSNWLREDEIIVEYTVTTPEGIESISTELVDEGTAILSWLGGGEADMIYLVKCHILTNQEREDTRTVILPVKER